MQPCIAAVKRITLIGAVKTILRIRKQFTEGEELGMSMRSPKKVLLASLWAALLAAGPALAELTFNMPEGVTPVSRAEHHLHMIVFWIVTIVGIGVFGVIVYSIINHRKSKGAVAAQFHESTTVEIIWTVIPLVILVAIAVPATKVVLEAYDSADPDLTVKVTGWQWKWEYDYPKQGIHFFSSLSTPQAAIENKEKKDEHYLREVDHPLVLPVGKKVEFLATAHDVIHSWWVPDLGIKKDAIPGYINTVWAKIERPGVYRGQCAELCGKGHAFMPIVVVAKTEQGFEHWVAEQKQAQAAAAAASGKSFTKAELMAQGQKNFLAHCAACHQANGEGIPATFPPLRQGHSFSATPAMLKHLRERGFLTDDGKIKMGPIKDHLHIVVHGIEGTAMQAFGPQLNDVEIASIVTYERNAWGNNTGDVIQPSDVKAAR